VEFALPFLLFPLFGLFFVFVIVMGVLGWQAEKKRRAALATEAARLNLHYSAAKDFGLARSLNYLDRMHSGSNRYAFNVIRGPWKNAEVLCFDYHYETHSTDSKGRRRTTHHYYAYVTLRLPKSFPELTIAPENFFSKIAQVVGYDDIDFESAEFSRKYTVRSKDRKFAYDFCNARMMEHLLRQPVAHLEVEHDRLALADNGKHKPETLAARLDRALEIRNLMPEYLFK
jgi:hypothetical protein